MTIFNDISKRAHDAGDWIWKVAGAPDEGSKDPVERISIDFQKEQEIMKLDNHQEREHDPTSVSNNTLEQAASKMTVIGEHISIEGIVRADEDLLIDGTLKGTIQVKSHRIAVGSNAKIEADIVAENVSIGGKMTGNILAHNSVTITQQADFTGQIKARRLSIEDGAYLKASIELQRPEPARSTVTEPTEAIVFDESKNKVTKKPAEIPTVRQAK